MIVRRTSIDIDVDIAALCPFCDKEVDYTSEWVKHIDTLIIDLEKHLCDKIRKAVKEEEEDE